MWWIIQRKINDRRDLKKSDIEISDKTFNITIMHILKKIDKKTKHINTEQFAQNCSLYN